MRLWIEWFHKNHVPYYHLIVALLFFISEAGANIPGQDAKKKENYTLKFHKESRDSLNIFCYGYADFFSIYTNMFSAYPDYQYPDKNLTFSPYPNPGLINRNTEQPLLFLATEGMNQKGMGFRIHFNLLHSFNGFSESFSKVLAFRTTPSFEVFKHTPYGIFSMTAGDCTGKTFISPLTLSGQTLTTHPFERLPWDWHLNSFDKYRAIYSEYHNPLHVTGLSASQGFVLSADSLLRHWGLKFFYGRTNFSITPPQVYERLPSSVMAGRMYYRIPSGFISANAYYHSLLPYKTAASPVRNLIASAAYNGRILKNLFMESELAYSELQTNTSSSASTAFSGSIEWNKPRKAIRIKSGVYSIPYGFAGKDNAVLNSNTHMPVSGIPGDHQYNLLLFSNPIQSPTVLANNRKGVYLMVGSNKRKLRFTLEQGLSREIRHIHDSLTFFHYDNSFTRSRFTPWVQGSGPYQRIGGRYRYTTETLPVNTSGAPLYFRATDLKIKYSCLLFNKNLILLISPGYRSAGTEYFKKSLFRSWFIDVASFYKILRNLNLLGFATIQNNQQLPSRPGLIHQQGLAWGLGVDIDIAKNASVFLRYKRFSHKDKNLIADDFRGEEITTELKVFF